VTVSGAGPAVTLRRERSGLMTDEYRGGGAVMTVDPEVHLSLPDRPRVGPCL
jgi:hypothetical protein